MIFRSADLNLTDLERTSLVRYCARFVGDPGVAEDLAQQALLTAWDRRAELRDPQALLSWLQHRPVNLFDVGSFA